MKLFGFTVLTALPVRSHVLFISRMKVLITNLNELPQALNAQSGKLTPLSWSGLCKEMH